MKIPQFTYQNSRYDYEKGEEFYIYKDEVTGDELSVSSEDIYETAKKYSEFETILKDLYFINTEKKSELEYHSPDFKHCYGFFGLCVDLTILDFYYRYSIDLTQIKELFCIADEVRVKLLYKHIFVWNLGAAHIKRKVKKVFNGCRSYQKNF